MHPIRSIRRLALGAALAGAAVGLCPAAWPARRRLRLQPQHERPGLRHRRQRPRAAAGHRRTADIDHYIAMPTAMAPPTRASALRSRRRPTRTRSTSSRPAPVSDGGDWIDQSEPAARSAPASPPSPTASRRSRPDLSNRAAEAGRDRDLRSRRHPGRWPGVINVGDDTTVTSTSRTGRSEVIVDGVGGADTVRRRLCQRLYSGARCRCVLGGADSDTWSAASPRDRLRGGANDDTLYSIDKASDRSPATTLRHGRRRTSRQGRRLHRAPPTVRLGARR